MTLSNVLFREIQSTPFDNNREKDLEENLSFTLKQHERSAIIPDTTVNERIIVSKSEILDMTQERIAYREVDDKFVQWIGRVLEVNGDSFTARIDPIRQRTTSKIAKFNVKNVIVLNEEQLEEGATFFWTVGLFRNNQGSFVKRSEIRFRFPIIPNKQAVDELALKKAQELFDGIGWLE